MLVHRFRVWGVGMRIEGVGFSFDFRATYRESFITKHTSVRRTTSPNRARGKRVRYRGTSLIGNSLPLGPYSRPMLGALCWS